MNYVANVIRVAIISLAAATSARATVTYLPIGNLTCATYSLPPGGSPGTSNCLSEASDGQLAPSGGIAGVSFFTTPQIVAIAGGGSVSIGMNDGGTLNQPLVGQDIEVSWDFTLSATGGATIDNWGLAFYLGSQPGGYDQYGAFNTCCFDGAGTFSGEGTISDVVASGAFYEEVIIGIETSGDGTVTLTAPFDIGAPEPASIATLGAGLAVIAWLFHRRRLPKPNVF